MKRIYVAGLYSRNEKGERAHIVEALANIRKGLLVGLKLLKAGYIPYIPFMDFLLFLVADIAPTEAEIKAYSMEMLRACDAVLVISGVGSGGGVDAEIEEAERLGIPVFDQINDPCYLGY